MTSFRSQDQIVADFKRLDPRFTQVTRRNQLLGYLSDHQLDEATAAATGAGPVLFNLGVLAGPEWVGVRAFLDNEKLVSAKARAEFRQLETDLKVADTDHNGFVNNQEMVTFVAKHTDRWANVAIFRTAANSYLNRLPAYIAQPNLTEQQVSRLWGIMNHLAKQWDATKTKTANRGTIYGLSMKDFPSSDRNRPPDLIGRAMSGRLTPEELASIHQVLKTQKNAEGKYVFDGNAPLNPQEIGMIGQLLQGAARAGRTFQGMTLLTGREEKKFFLERNQATERFQKDLREAKGDSAAIQKAFQRLTQVMSRLESDQPQKISATTLFLRTYMGDLNPSEVASLREWMKTEAQLQGLTCSGALDCLRTGFLRFFKSIADNPWHFIARNGAFLAGAYLYRRYVLQNVVAHRLSNLCGAPIADPRQAWRDYEAFVKTQVAQKGLLQRLPRSVLQNPYVGLAIFNFGIAPLKDTGKLGIDILTDQLLLPFTFEAFETWDAFRNQQTMQDFVHQNPALCRPVPQPAVAPEPETVAEAETEAQLAARPLREFSQANYEAYLQPQILTTTFHNTPTELIPLLTAETRHGTRTLVEQIEAFRKNPSALGDLLVGQYAKDSADEARIREDVADMMSAFTNETLQGLIPTFRWALQIYLQGLETGQLVTGQWIADFAGAEGVAHTYFVIRNTMENTGVSFDQAAQRYWESMEAQVPKEFQFVFKEYRLRDSWEDHIALDRFLPRAGDVLAARFALENPALAKQIRWDMAVLSRHYKKYGSEAQPITNAATNSYKWALREYVSALMKGNDPQFEALLAQIQTEKGLRQVDFVQKEAEAIKKDSEDYEHRYRTDPFFRAYQDSWARIELEQIGRLSQMDSTLGGRVMVMPIINGVPPLPPLPFFSFGPVFSPAPVFVF